MSIRGLLWACVVLGVAGAAAGSEPSTRLSDEEVALLDQARREGARMHLHDRAAANATDALQADRRRFKRHAGQLGGWVTESVAGDLMRVSFLDRSEGGSRQVIARVMVDGKGKVRGKPQWQDPPVPASVRQNAAANAVRQAGAAAFERCADRYNSIVMPARDAPGWVVWLLPATTDAAVIPFGGAQRFEFDASGDTLRGQRGYTRTCVKLQRPGEGAEVAMMVTHLMDPVPTALHVHAALSYGLPFFVGTSDRRIWAVEGAQIRLVRDGEKDAPAADD